MDTIELRIVILIVSIGALGIPACAVLYLQRAQLARPPIGVCDRSDLFTLFVSIIVMPLIYLAIPNLFLTILLTLLLVSLVRQCLRPLLPNLVTWLLTLALVAANLLATLAVQAHWPLAAPLHWLINDLLVLMAAVTASNLYAQWGMRIGHVAWLALFLACYDAVCAWVIPLTPLLAFHFEGAAFVPAFGFIVGNTQGFVGLGDLFVFSLVAVVAYKGFGTRGLLTSFVLIALFGILLPHFILHPLASLIGRGSTPGIPVQAVFGPAVFVASYWLSRSKQERSVREWLAQRRSAREDQRSAEQRKAASAIAFARSDP